MTARPADLLGIQAILAGMVVITLQDTAVKWLSPHYALHEIMLSRAVIGLGVALGLLRLEGGLHLLRTRRLGAHLLRGALLVVANVAFFLAVAVMPLAEAVAIFFVAPLFITALSVPVLGERVGPRRWAAVLVGLAGVVVMTRPGGGAIDWIALLPVLAALAYATMQMVTRKLGATDRASTMAFYMQVTFIVVSAGIGLGLGDGRFEGAAGGRLDFLLRAWRWPAGGDAWLFVWCGISSGLGGYLLSQAYRLGEAALVAPFEYVALPLAMAWGALLWGDWPDQTAGVGMALILGAGVYLVYREHARFR